MGRPAFIVTLALRQRVCELISCGMSHDDIARAIGCAKMTLQKHFKEELTTGAAQKRAEIIGLLYESAAGGNVQAQKKLEELSRPGGAEALGTKLGKKEEQQQAADRLTGKFAPPAPPKLVVSNG